MTLNGVDTFGNLTYEYVRMPKIDYVIPFLASGWSKRLEITLFGTNFFFANVVSLVELDFRARLRRHRNLHAVHSTGTAREATSRQSD
jgi:hypothetical protein